jgi:predicted outer membrane repeat protein
MNRFKSVCSLSAGLAGIILICAPVTSRATTRRVPATYPTIQAAINAAVKGDTVLVSPGFYSGPGNVALNPGGKAITIKSASGPGSCVIDGGNSNQIFVIQSGETTSTVIYEFTLQRGSGYAGGAVAISNSSPTLSNIVFVDNSAIYGGGCYASVGATNTPVFSNCTFLENKAGDGGEESWGGGLMVVGGAGSIKDCSFISNVAIIPGGWISEGGALALQSDKTKVTNCAFDANVAWDGGGVIVDSNSLASFDYCTFDDNSGFGNGGGCDVTDGANPTFVNCVFTDNYGAFAGGLALFSGLGARIDACVFDHNTTDYVGGGLGNWGGILNISNCTFTANNASGSGGGMWTNSPAKNTLTACTFDSNTAVFLGGGLYAQGATPTVISSVFVNNTVSDSTSTGGGAYCSNSSTFKACLFDGNSATYGGGLAIGGYNSGSTSIVVNSIFENNTASHLAGGVHVEGGTAYITQCTFSGNQATSQAGQGDGICCQAYFTLTVSDTILWDSQRGTPGSDLNTDASGAVTFRYVDDYDGVQPGKINISADPQFTDVVDGNLVLLSTSPCLHTASAKVPQCQKVDFDGELRSLTTPSMGAYEN